MVNEFNVGAAEHGILLSHHMPDGDGVYMKEIRVPAGKEIFPHKHTFTHKSILACGRAAIRCDGKDEVVADGPHVVAIEKGLQHSIVALTDIVWFCIHSTEERDAEKIDHTLVGEY